MWIWPIKVKCSSAFAMVSFKDDKYCIDPANTMMSNFLSGNIQPEISFGRNLRLGRLAKTRLACCNSLLSISTPITSPDVIPASLAANHPLPQPTSSILIADPTCCICSANRLKYLPSGIADLLAKSLFIMALLLNWSFFYNVGVQSFVIITGSKSLYFRLPVSPYPLQ